MAILKTALTTLLSISTIIDVSLALPGAAPALTQPRAPCSSPVLRKEWSAATADEQQSYINAVLCLPTKPSRIGLNSTLYDDFAYVHNALNLQIHGVAAFLPWHRYFVHVYEAALQDCGYTGVAMYWDWVADSAAPASAAVWSATTGFGGNGVPTNTSDEYSYCVIDGPFTGLLPVYKNNDTHPHCLERDFYPAIPQAGLQEMLGFQYTPAVMATINAYDDYIDFQPNLQSQPHGAVHAGIGSSWGDMGPLTSPNDPIFFLHHTQVDRVWWLWQQVSPSNRTNDYAGNTEVGSDVNDAELTDIMPMMGFADDRIVGDFMSTQTADLCYMYE